MLIIIILIIIISSYTFYLLFDYSNYNYLKNKVNESNQKFSKEIWLENTRLEIFKDLSKNYLKKGIKYELVEEILGEEPLYYRIYDNWFYKRKCKQYYLGRTTSLGSVSMYAIVCPDKEEKYVEDVFTIYHKSFTWTFNSGVEVKNEN